MKHRKIGGREIRAQARQRMADLEAYNSALAHAKLLWPKMKSAPRAQSTGLPCSVHQLARSRCDWTLMTPWDELLKSAVVWKHVRLFMEIDIVRTTHGRKTEDIIVLRQHSAEIFTFRPTDLNAATLSFVWAPDGAQVVPCMLLDVLPRLADKHCEAFSYVVMFQQEGHARLVHNRLQGSWYQKPSPVACADAAAGHQASGGIDVASFLNNDPDDSADDAVVPESQSASKLAIDGCSSKATCGGSNTCSVVALEDDFLLDTDCHAWEESLLWDELACT
jgi:hypothetical protein